MGKRKSNQEKAAELTSAAAMGGAGGAVMGGLIGGGLGIVSTGVVAVGWPLWMPAAAVGTVVGLAGYGVYNLFQDENKV